MIEARFRKSFPPRRDSAGFTLDIDMKAEGGVTVLFGPSGAGKTLTIDAIAGFLKPDTGRILLDDQILFDAEARVHVPAQARRCGYVFQSDALFPHMTLRQNLEFAAERVPRLERHRRVGEMLERFRLLEVAGRRPYEVSGGQRQRCAIARALTGSSRLLLLDEPARGLDASLRAELYSTIREVREGFAVPALLVTHDLEECFELADEMIVITGGRVVQTGKPRAVLDRPAGPEVAQLFGDYNLVPVEIRALDPARNTSRLRIAGHEIVGPYFPGRLIGDRALLGVLPSELSIAPANGRAGPSQIPARLTRVSETRRGYRLEFESAMIVDVPRDLFEAHRNEKNWTIEFPASRLRLI